MGFSDAFSPLNKERDTNREVGKRGGALKGVNREVSEPESQFSWAGLLSLVLVGPSGP